MTRHDKPEGIKFTHRSEEARELGMRGWIEAGYTPVYWTTERWTCQEEEPPDVH